MHLIFKLKSFTLIYIGFDKSNAMINKSTFDYMMCQYSQQVLKFIAYIILSDEAAVITSPTTCCVTNRKNI